MIFPGQSTLDDSLRYQLIRLVGREREKSPTPTVWEIRQEQTRSKGGRTHEESATPERKPWEKKNEAKLIALTMKRNWIHRSFDWMGISSESNDELVRVDISS
jgi:hypothetical protein